MINDDNREWINKACEKKNKIGFFISPASFFLASFPDSNFVLLVFFANWLHSFFSSLKIDSPLCYCSSLSYITGRGADCMLLLLVFQPSFDHHHHHWRQKYAQKFLPQKSAIIALNSLAGPRPRAPRGGRSWRVGARPGSGRSWCARTTSCN